MAKTRKCRRSKRVKGRKHKKHTMKRRRGGDNNKITKWYSNNYINKGVCKDNNNSIIQNMNENYCKKGQYTWEPREGCYYNDIKLEKMNTFDKCDNIKDILLAKNYVEEQEKLPISTEPRP